MELVFTWFFFALLVGIFAGSRGRGGISWFFISIIISPLLAFLLVLVMAPLGEQRTRREVEAGRAKVCPQCAEEVKPAAKVCRFCGHKFA